MAGTGFDYLTMWYKSDNASGGVSCFGTVVINKVEADSDTEWMEMRWDLTVFGFSHCAKR